VNDHIEIPKEFIEAHKGCYLVCVHLHIEGVTFLLTLCKNVLLIAIQLVKDRKVTLLEAVDGAFGNYNKAGFEVKEFHADNEFCCLKQHLEVVDTGPNFLKHKMMCQELKDWVEISRKDAEPHATVVFPVIVGPRQ